MIGNLAVGIQDFVVPAPLGDFESIATVTVGSGAASSIDFTSISQDFQHLQIRVLSRDNRAATINSVFYRLNSDTGSNYAYHVLAGDGSSASAGATTSASFTYGMVETSASTSANIFTVAVIDILDYSNTNKYTTIRTLQGYDSNGSGNIRFNSGLWMNTAGVTDIKIFPDGAASFVQYSHFALYGIKG